MNRTRNTSEEHAREPHRRSADTLDHETGTPAAARSAESLLHPEEALGNGNGNGRLHRWREDLAAVEPERAAMIGGAAALGVVFGAAAATLAKRRG